MTLRHVLITVGVLYWLAGLMFGPSHDRVQAGQRCGPNHYWNAAMSCEEDDL